MPDALQPERQAVNGASERIRARALAHSRARMTRAPGLLRLVAFSIAILLHLFGATCLYLLMRPHPTPDEGRIEVRLIVAAPAEPALPVPPPNRLPPLASTRVAAQHAPAARVTSAVSSPVSVESTPYLHLYKPDGGIDIPAVVADQFDAEPLRPFTPKSTAPSSLMTLKRPVKTRPNHFSGAWKAPQGENLLGAALRNTAEFVDKNLTVEKEFDTPLGKIKCKATFMIVMAGGGCVDVPPKPYDPPKEKWKPATVLDEQ